MKCPMCPCENLQVTREAYKYEESGLSNVTLLDVEMRRCPDCGEEMPVIPRIDELHTTIANAIVGQRPRLSPNEIRFLREYLGYSRDDFAGRIGVARETLSRWENGKAELSAQADRLLRMLVVNDKRVEGYDSAALLTIDEDRREPSIRVRRQGQDWQATA